MSILDRLYKTIIGDIFEEYSITEKMEIFFSNVFSILAIIVTLFYGVINLFNGIYLSASIEISIAIIIALIFFISRRVGESKTLSLLKIFLIMGLLTYIFLTGGDNGTGFLWLYTIPLSIFTVLSTGIGIIITIFYYSLLLVFYFLHITGFFTLPYNKDDIETFFLTLLVVTTIVFLFKFLQEETVKFLHKKNIEIERANSKRERELIKSQMVKQKLIALNSKLLLKEEEFQKTKEAIVNILEDMNEESSEAISQAEDLIKFKEAVENSFDHIVFTSLDGEIIYANKAVEKTTGFSHNEMIGQTPRLWGGQMPKEFYEEFWETIKYKKKRFIGEVVNRRKNGELYDAAVQVIPILGDMGEIKFFVGIERDITEDKGVEKIKSEFVSIASHQLRTPATGVKWFTELLLDKKNIGNLTEEQVQYLQEISDSNDRMLKIINDLLNVSKIESGSKFIINITSSDASKLIDDEIKYVSILAEKTNVSVKKDKSIPKKLIMDIDAEKFAQVFKNLLDNAVKYSPEKGEVLIGMDEKDGVITFYVKDNGIGIPEKQRERVFEKFFRADNVLKADTDGTGLGLYIVKEIVEGHNGSIRFETEVGKGTTFFVSFPKEQLNKDPRVLRV